MHCCAISCKVFVSAVIVIGATTGNEFLLINHLIQAMPNPRILTLKSSKMPPKPTIAQILLLKIAAIKTQTLILTLTLFDVRCDPSRELFANPGLNPNPNSNPNPVSN